MPRDRQQYTDLIERLRGRLREPLPGHASLARLVLPHRPRVSAEQARARGAVEAAALALLYPVGDACTAHTVLTVRSADLRNHAGQISLPGGRIDAGEEPVAAALREAWEELSIPGSALDVLGQLSPVYIPPTEFLVSPTVAAAPRRPDFKPHDAEVAGIIEVAVAHFAGDAHVQVETWTIRGQPRRVPFYAVGGHKVWGATALMLSELGVLWEEIAAGTGTGEGGGETQ